MRAISTRTIVKISLLTLLIWGLGFVACGCTTRAADRCASLREEANLQPTDSYSVYLVNHGHHAGIVIPLQPIPKAQWVNESGFGGYDFLEVGWGDEAFYRAGGMSIKLGLKALFMPTPSVLHLVGIRGGVRHYFEGQEVLSVTVPQESLERLSTFIEDSFARDEEGNIQWLGPGLYGSSAFFRAEGNYHLANTCNTWSARALNAAGCKLRLPRAITASGLFGEVRSR